MRSKYKLFSIVTLMGLIFLLSRCGSDSESFQTIGDYSISLKLIPDPPAIGLNKFEVRVLAADGTPPDNATVHIHYFMPAMAGMPEMTGESEAKQTGDGPYLAEIDLGAGGKFPWDIRVEIVQNQNILAITRWQVAPGTSGVKFLSGEGSGESQGIPDYYTCTMHPSVKHNEPGTCPICAMNLIPVYKEAGETTSPNLGTAAANVNIPFYQQQLIGVQKDTVQIRSVEIAVRTVGHVAYAESHIASVNLKYSGWIEKLHGNYTGQLVQKDQALFEIYSPELVSTQEEYLQLWKSSREMSPKSNSGEVKQLLERTRQRLLLWGVPEKEIEGLAKLDNPPLQLTYYSPIKGHIIEKNIREGQHVKAGNDLYAIADLSTVWIYADIYEHELPLVKVHQRATVTLSYDPGVIYVGKVDYVYPTLAQQTRTARLRLVFPNPDLKLKPEMYANVEIGVDVGEQLTVVESSVLNTGIRQLVFVDIGNGRFEPREIKLGHKVGRYYTVTEGLKLGEVVVKSGNFLIDAEAHVQGVLQTM